MSFRYQLVYNRCRNGVEGCYSAERLEVVDIGGDCSRLLYRKFGGDTGCIRVRGAKTMKIILNAGHTASGSGSGAVGFISESEETRKVVNAVKRYLTGKGHDVVVANVDRAGSQYEYLREVVRIANKHIDADLFLSVHFNAGGGQGCECYTYKGKKTPQAEGICAELNKHGFRNRGVKDGSPLYVISKTKMPAILAEVCFVDNIKDARKYEEVGVNRIAQAITRGILR